MVLRQVGNIRENTETSSPTPPHPQASLNQNPGSHFSEANRASGRKLKAGGARIKGIPRDGMGSPGSSLPHTLPLSLGPFNNNSPATENGNKGHDKNFPSLIDKLSKDPPLLTLSSIASIPSLAEGLHSRTPSEFLKPQATSNPYSLKFFTHSRG